MRSMRIVILLALTFAVAAHGEKKSVPARGAAKTFDEPLKVQGQNRLLNMGLVLRSKNEYRKALSERKDYVKEVLGTSF